MYINEKWKAVIGFLGYEVSNLGRVRSYWKHNGRNKPTLMYTPQHPMKGGKDKKNHIMITLKLDGKQYTKQLSRLVLETFVGPCPKGMEACHGPNGIYDNSLSNLYWGTRSRNNGEDKKRDGTAIYGEKQWNCKLSKVETKKIKEEYRKRPPGHNDCQCHKDWPTQKQLAEKYGVHQSNISYIVRNKSRKNG